MKYLFLIAFLLTASDSHRTSLGFLSTDQIQYKFHTNEAIDQFFVDEALNEVFPISDYFQAGTRFWFLIYTYFDDNKLILHDRNNLGLVYQVQDFSSLQSKNVHPFAQSFIQDKLIKEKISQLKRKLLDLSESPLPKDPELIGLYNQVRKAGINVGTTPSEHQEAFTTLSRNLRAQRGLRNHIEAGLSRYNPYSHFLDRYFESHGLPKELVSISFLESSFNPHAHSKSRAVGVWQFMPFLQRSFFPQHKNLDYRLNIGISSTAAANLLKENYQILKRWDLAVTAYNSGIRHIIKEKRTNSELTLQSLIEESANSSFGFASKNFYAEFLALARVLKHRDKLFPIIKDIEVYPELHFYFAKCDINLTRSFSTDQRDYLRSLNHHLKKNNLISRGTLITTDTELSPVFYQKISWKDLVGKRPKNWVNPKKRYSCSTR